MLLANPARVFMIGLAEAAVAHTSWARAAPAVRIRY